LILAFDQQIPEETHEEYLVEYLREEFGRFEQIRVQIRKEDGERGVLVRSESRQWFFPFDWANPGQGFKKVHVLVRQIREILE
jgi:hypothetical protein